MIFENLGDDFSGNAHCDIITLNTKTTSYRELLRTFFHELGHVHCYRHHIWKVIHDPDEQRDIRSMKRIICCALKAERWVDRWAYREARKHYPRFVPYCPYYAKSKRIIQNALEAGSYGFAKDTLKEWEAATHPHERFLIEKRLLIN